MVLTYTQSQSNPYFSRCSVLVKDSTYKARHREASNEYKIYRSTVELERFIGILTRSTTVSFLITNANFSSIYRNRVFLCLVRCVALCFILWTANIYFPQFILSCKNLKKNSWYSFHLKKKSYFFVKFKQKEFI